MRFCSVETNRNGNRTSQDTQIFPIFIYSFLQCVPVADCGPFFSLPINFVFWIGAVSLLVSCVRVFGMFDVVKDKRALFRCYDSLAPLSAGSNIIFCVRVCRMNNALFRNFAIFSFFFGFFLVVAYLFVVLSFVLCRVFIGTIVLKCNHIDWIFFFLLLRFFNLHHRRCKQHTRTHVAATHYAI